MEHKIGDVIILDYVIITLLLASTLGMFLVKHDYNYAIAFYLFVQFWFKFLNLKSFEEIMFDVDIENRRLRSNVESICSTLDY